MRRSAGIRLHLSCQVQIGRLKNWIICPHLVFSPVKQGCADLRIVDAVPIPVNTVAKETAAPVSAIGEAEHLFLSLFFSRESIRVGPLRAHSVSSCSLSVLSYCEDRVYWPGLSSGLIWLAFFPVKNSCRDLSFKTLRFLRNTSLPKGCILLRELVWMKTLEVCSQCLFSTLRSSWAEIPSKSPFSLRCRFSLFLYKMILKFVATSFLPRSNECCRGR
jgi:hypothetical protein